MTSPLAGKRIVITRPPEKAADLADLLRGRGAEPVIMPTITTRPPADPGPLDSLLRQLPTYDWVIFTSANAVDYTWPRLEALSIDPIALEGMHFAAIGPATAHALEAHGVHPALVPREHVAEALFEALREQAPLTDLRILIPHANLARPVLVDLLRGAGAVVDTAVAYETVRPDIDPAILAEPFDAVTFTSPSTVRHFVELFDDPKPILGAAQVVCIGPITADAAREVGLAVHAEAEPHTAEGLVAALEDLFERNTDR